MGKRGKHSSFKIRTRVVVSALQKTIETMAHDSISISKTPHKKSEHWREEVLNFLKKAKAARMEGVEMNNEATTFQSLRGFKNFVDELSKVVQTRCEWRHMGVKVGRGHARGSAVQIETGDNEESVKCGIVQICRKRSSPTDQGLWVLSFIFSTF